MAKVSEALAESPSPGCDGAFSSGNLVFTLVLRGGDISHQVGKLEESAHDGYMSTISQPILTVDVSLNGRYFGYLPSRCLVALSNDYKQING